MRTAEVKKLKPLDQFLYWMRERHNVYLRRRAGAPKPWTDDEVLQSYFFTHPYRELDKVTVWFRENIREPLRNDRRVLFATVCFRWFNLPETGLVLMGNKQPRLAQGRLINPGGSLLYDWDCDEVMKRLGAVRDKGGQVFTGAFMINSPPGSPKLEAIVERVNNVWEGREELLEKIAPDGPSSTYQGVSNALRYAHECLTKFPGLGGFMAYEVVCDLRYTYLLEKAPDKLTWCNPGPGCIRGIYRLRGMDFPKGNNSTSPPRPRDAMEYLQELLAIARRKLVGMPPLEMREIEHSLCEYDKYSRALEGDGKLKRRYNGSK
jgi:hypothetical protein